MRRIKSVGGMDLQRNSFGGARKVTPPVIPELSEVKSHEQPAYRGSYIATDQVAGIPPRIPVGQSKKVQPPGRTSPGEDSTTSTSTIGSLYNSSTTSVDSGCASNSTDPPRSVRSSTFQPHPRHSSASSISLGSGSSFRHSYHSSCSSLGSNGKLEDDICSLNIEEMVENNVPDSEVLNAWLTDLHFEEYYDLFLSAGYDMPTISRMTPEDLTAIGIKKPNHRKRLKEEISKLKISDGLPNYVPFSLEEWLHCIKLSQYVPHLQVQGFRTIEDMTQICIEDLEDIGVYKLGHQKRLLLAIKRIKDLRAGRVTQVRPKQSSFQQEHRQSVPSQHGLSTFHNPPPSSHGAPIQYHPEFIRIEPHHRPAGATNSQIYSTNERSFTPQQIYGTQQQFSTQQHQLAAQPQPIYGTQQQPQPQFGAQHQQQYAAQQPPQPTYGSQQPQQQPHFPPPMRQLPSQDWTKMFAAPAPVVPPRRCYEEGDNTVTASSFDHFAPLRHHLNVGGGGTLPRPKGYVKPRPVAMIPAHTRTEAEVEQEDGDLKQCFDNQMTKEANSLPFANDNVGTIRLKPSVHPRIPIDEESQQENNWQQQAQEQQDQDQTIPAQTAANQRSVPGNNSRTAGDVLNDIGSMLADLTNELDAMLHLEKDQPQ